MSKFSEECRKIEGETPTKGVKHDDNKAPMSLIPYYTTKQIAEVFGFGAKKYGRHNYRAGIEWSRVIEAAERHLGAFKDGQDLDPESGKSHLAHLGCCVIMLLTYIEEHPELDDRYVPNPKK